MGLAVTASAASAASVDLVDLVDLADSVDGVGTAPAVQAGSSCTARRSSSKVRR